MSVAPLYLMHTQPDPQRLAAWAIRHSLWDSQGDLGYALHALLRAAFGANGPQPFRYLDSEQGLLAYTRLSATELMQHAALADPEVAAALGLGPTQQHAGMNARLFPTQWAAGHTLGFEVRVRPVIREGKTRRELDAFLSAVEKSNGAALDRNAIYVQWLRDLFTRQGGAEILNATVTGYQRLGVTRRTQITNAEEHRRSHLVSGPDAMLVGQLRVSDSVAFGQLIANGVGRHKAFGFGLLLLRSARE